MVGTAAASDNNMCDSSGMSWTRQHVREHGRIQEHHLGQFTHGQMQQVSAHEQQLSASCSCMLTVVDNAL